MTPIQKGSDDADIGGAGVVRQSSKTRGNDHFVQIPFGEFSKRAGSVKVFGNYMEIVND